MKRRYLLIGIAAFLLIATVAFVCYYIGERNAALNGTVENRAMLPFSLTGGGLALGVARWFYNKIIQAIAAVFKLVIAFMLLLAAGMAIAAL